MVGTGDESLRRTFGIRIGIVEMKYMSASRLGINAGAGRISCAPTPSRPRPERRRTLAGLAMDIAMDRVFR